jgi:hypothetical protein
MPEKARNQASPTSHDIQQSSIDPKTSSFLYQNAPKKRKKKNQITKVRSASSFTQTLLFNPSIIRYITE